MVAGDFCELFMYPPLIRIEERARDIPHLQSLQKGWGSLLPLGTNSQSRERE